MSLILISLCKVDRLIKIVFLGIALIYLGGMVYQVSYFAYFKLNQEEIIAKYCVNKDRPEMHCNGQCHLNKELKKVKTPVADEPSEENSENLPEFEFNFLIGFFTGDSVQRCDEENPMIVLFWNTKEELCCSDSIPFWHPPQV